MIDHDALARRIAKRLTRNGFIHESSTFESVSKCISINLREDLPTSDEVCEWTDSEWETVGKWNTSCGQSFGVIDDWPSENGFRFCCYCGKKLIEVQFEEPEGEES